MDDFVTLTALEEDNGKRIDVFLSEKLEVSRSGAAKLAENGNVELNGKVVAKNLKIKTGMVFEVSLPEPVPSEAVPQDIPLDILY
ncbi:MAG: RNA pseudouridine synthase, partial [Clostridia bacterium]|nr:RNA pseudouridine synthase [Clostridia bacterium]